MDSRWRSASILSGVLFAGFSGAHLIDEFVWGAPAEFHLAEDITELLALAYMTALVGLIAAAARASRAGFLGLAITGGLIGVADLLKHGMEIAAPGPWRFGAVSVGLALGLTLSALATALASAMAWRVMRSPEARSPSGSGSGTGL
jgi:hypothetical protein